MQQKTPFGSPRVPANTPLKKSINQLRRRSAPVREEEGETSTPKKAKASPKAAAASPKSPKSPAARKSPKGKSPAGEWLVLDFIFLMQSF